MKKSLLLLMLASTMLVTAQNKRLYVTTQVGGAMMRFSLYQKQNDNSFSLLKQQDEDSGFWLFDSLDAGTYRVHVNIGYTKYLPTWFPSAAVWNLATDIELTADSQTVSVGMIPNLALSGPASIVGFLNEGLFKTAGEPLQNTRVIITNASDLFVTMTSTNDSGRFSVSNLPVGTYKILVDVINASNANPKSVALDSSNLIASVDLTVNKSGTNNTGLGKTYFTTQKISLFPNPSSETVSINVDGEFFLSLFDGTGKQVMLQKLTRYDVVTVQQLPQGLYFAKLSKTDGTLTESLRFVKY